MKKKVAIIGYGWVGKAMHGLLDSPQIEVVVYDKEPATYTYLGIKSHKKSEVNKCDIAFICVPTPPEKDGSLDTSIVEDCVDWCECPLIVIRSTVNPGTCDIMEECWPDNAKRIVMQPEYLGETTKHPFSSMSNRKFIIIGGNPSDRRELIELYTMVYNANVKIRQVTNLEAEIIKLSENRAIAFKVAQCQELYDVCKKARVDYYTIRDAVYGDDPRFNLWFSFVFPENRGFNSKCLPKDVYAWCAWAESCGYSPYITRAILDRNERWIK